MHNYEIKFTKKNIKINVETNIVRYDGRRNKNEKYKQ